MRRRRSPRRKLPIPARLHDIGPDMNPLGIIEHERLLAEIKIFVADEEGGARIELEFVDGAYGPSVHHVRGLEGVDVDELGADPAKGEAAGRADEARGGQEPASVALERAEIIDSS